MEGKAGDIAGSGMVRALRPWPRGAATMAPGETQWGLLEILLNITLELQARAVRAEDLVLCPLAVIMPLLQMMEVGFMSG